jgi:hypothetical protein
VNAGNRCLAAASRIIEGLAHELGIGKELN